MTPFWVEVSPTDVRAFSDTHATHKQGWIRVGCRLRVVELYQEWYQINALVGPHAVTTSLDYPEIWVEKAGTITSVSPDPTPIPTVVTDAQAAAAFLTLVKYLKNK